MHCSKILRFLHVLALFGSSFATARVLEVRTRLLHAMPSQSPLSRTIGQDCQCRVRQQRSTTWLSVAQQVQSATNLASFMRYRGCLLLIWRSTLESHMNPITIPS
ncbi:hypothetical protein QBC46DRAFT_370924 [Diplogelasinospora grovesii]|uniref:Secreted protein n=1 Tax=Diplogelasinospora grovesii TaxID=303347 RepID=A0AAN6S908_9PEZI|nr:hypothetical protein QBC46DRAFT_370924 [Diplogelasinospora grovesii]